MEKYWPAEWPRYIRTALVLLPSVLIVYFFTNIFLYIIVAVVVALIIRPLMNQLIRLKLGSWSPPRALAATIGLLAFYLVLGALLLLLIPPLLSELNQLAKMDPQLLLLQLEDPLNNLEAFLARHDIQLDAQKMLQERLNEQLNDIIDPRAALLVVENLLGAAGKLLTGWFAVSFMAFFFLVDRRIPLRILLFLSPSQYNLRVVRVAYKIKYMLRRYIQGLVLDVLVVSLLLFIGLSLLGVQSALFLAIMGGVLNVIPYVGPVLGGLLAVTTSITQFLAAGQEVPSGVLLGIMAVFTAVQVLDALLIQPQIYASSVKAHPLEIFIVILMAATLGGVTAMVFAVPGYTVFRVVAAEFLRDNRAVATLTRGL